MCRCDNFRIYKWENLFIIALLPKQVITKWANLKIEHHKKFIALLMVNKLIGELANQLIGISAN